LPDNKHSQNSELYVTGNISIHKDLHWIHVGLDQIQTWVLQAW